MEDEILGSSILLLGFSREGQSTYAWLRKHYPKMRIAIADKTPLSSIVDSSVPVYSGSDYLHSLSEYSTVIRSPGISPYLSELINYQKNGGHITSATNIFVVCS
jgi:UDP-N-acetylmuramoylalanine-D-glutamate ligase